MKRCILITSIIIILICSFIINVSAENLTELSTNDLFIKYPYYLNNTETNEIIRNATDTYNNVMSDYDENDEFISALKSGVSSNVEVIIRDLGSKLGLMDSYYETCMDTATIELMQTLYADENLIAGLDVVKKSSELLENVKTVSEITDVKSCEIAGHLENLSESDVLAMTEELVENSGEILESVEDAVNMAKYIYIACIITDVELEMIDILMERVDKNGELYEGLSRLRHKMSYNVVEYTGLTFIKNKGLACIADTVTKLGLNSLGISTGPFLIGQIIAKTAVWVMFDVIYPHPGADEVISNMIHSMYVMELETALINQRLVFDSPFFVSDMDDYETVFSVYLATIKTTLESSKALAKTETAKQSLVTAKAELERALPNYEAYINKCKNVALNTAETDRIMRPADQELYVGNIYGVVTFIGKPRGATKYEIIPLTSDGSTYFKIRTGSNLIVNEDVSIPELSLGDTLEVNANIIIEGNLNNGHRLIMEDDDDYVLVKGNCAMDKGSTQYMTAGTLEIKGNVSGGGYTPSGTHKTILSGDKQQSVNLYHYSDYASDRYRGNFNILEIRNTSEKGVSLSYSRVTKELYADENSVINVSGIELTEDAKIRGDKWKHDITLYKWNDSGAIHFMGNVCIDQTTLTNTHIFEKDVYITSNYYVEDDTIFNAPQEILGNLKIEERFVIGAKTKVNGSVEINSNSSSAKVVQNDEFEVFGRLYLGNGGTMTVNDKVIANDFENTGTLKMEQAEGYVLVKGDYEQNRAPYGDITAGTLEVKGNMLSCGGYHPTGTHKTVLSGEKRQEVSLRYYNYSGPLDGTFNILEIRNISEEGVIFADRCTATGDILQPVGTILTNTGHVKLQGKSAFVDYGELNVEINKFNGNAENVTPTWLDYERYCKFALDGDMAFTLNESVTDTTFDCDLYFSNDYNKTSAIVILAFYDDDNRLVQMALKPIEVKAGKIDVSIDYENKPYSKYKIMVWEGLGNLKPLMMVK